MKILLSAIIINMLVSCFENQNFLENFIEQKEGVVLYTKLINEEDLTILLATNEVNQPLFNIDNKYFYGFKKKLDESHYLISIKNTYQPNYRFTNKLSNWEDIYYCIFDINSNAVVSKLKVLSSDPVLSFVKEEGDTYIITSKYHKFIPVESECNGIDVQNETKISKYKIVKNRFVSINN